MKIGKKGYVEIQNYILIICWLTLSIGASLRPESLRDYYVYKDAFYTGEFERAEIGYQILNHWFGQFTYDIRIFFFVIASISIGLKCFAIKRMSSEVLLSLILYISYFYILHDLIQIRTGIAAGILLFSFDYIIKRNFIIYLLIILCASLFHYSAICFVPIYFFNCHNIRKNIYILLIPFIYLLNFLGFHLSSLAEHLPIPLIRDAVVGYKNLMSLGMHEGINVLNFLIIVRITIFLVITYFIDSIRNHSKYAIILLKAYISAIIIYVLFSDIPAIAIRVSELLMSIEIILIPLLIYIPFKFNIPLKKYGIVGIAGVMLLIASFYNKYLG